ncbi:hypothetical protein [Limosilactobacillus antri]|uniref:hypothetical protein n=1 Tax=Limosilactobacillus antri TaxID=227943 RepID=UPI001F58AE65|nr:hypothetical protein [Limosilactobacillus antri]
MKFNRYFYKTSSFYFGLALVLAPLVNLAVSQDPVGKLLNYGCQLFGLCFLIAAVIKRDR